MECSSNITHGDAKAITDTLLKDPENRKKWREYTTNKPPSKHQKEQLKFFGQQIQKTMTTTEAKQLIKQLMEVSDNAANWTAYEDEQDAESQLLDELNEYPEDYDSKKISKKRFQEVLRVLKTEGHTAKSLWEGDTDIFYDKALNMFPELARASS